MWIQVTNPMVTMPNLKRYRNGALKEEVTTKQHYMGRNANEKLYRPFVFLSIFWAFSIHMVTTFLYQGLPARPFWNNPLLGPRFLASAFAAGPALIALISAVIHNFTTY